ncbi:MAG TPA: YihA family ribosome biogenesis GTP-binding protein [Candidatus Onthousia faecigallinarum]|nr:YihA family ribosome biogenesis GTP-binding protein [Candidatus Onthousia faecigallinarum]
MKITNAELAVMATRRSQYPEDGKPEFLLVGRSNVGKSSFINTLLERKNLAYTSSRPGKTQTLNFYEVNHEFYLIDVPGYGYAEVSRSVQEKFGKMIEEYLETRKELKRVFFLVDFRHKPSEDDVMMYNFLKYYKIPVTIVATKADKIGTSKREKCKKQILETLDLVVGDNLVIFSSETKEGKEEIQKELEDLAVDTI